MHAFPVPLCPGPPPLSLSAAPVCCACLLRSAPSAAAGTDGARGSHRMLETVAEPRYREDGIARYLSTSADIRLPIPTGSCERVRPASGPSSAAGGDRGTAVRPAPVWGRRGLRGPPGRRYLRGRVSLTSVPGTLSGCSVCRCGHGPDSHVRLGPAALR